MAFLFTDSHLFKDKQAKLCILKHATQSIWIKGQLSKTDFWWVQWAKGIYSMWHYIYPLRKTALLIPSMTRSVWSHSQEFPSQSLGHVCGLLPSLLLHCQPLHWAQWGGWTHGRSCGQGWGCRAELWAWGQEIPMRKEHCSVADQKCSTVTLSIFARSQMASFSVRIEFDGDCSRWRSLIWCLN